MKARRTAALAVIAAFLFTVAASVAPKLHDRLHHAADSGTHTCAITLVSSGSYHHGAAGPLLSRPVIAGEHALVIPHLCLRVTGGLEFSLLEHAPPSFS